MRPENSRHRSGFQQECYGNIPRNQRARNLRYHQTVSAVSRAARSQYPSCRQICLIGCAVLVMTSSLPVASSSSIARNANVPRVPDVFLRGLFNRAINATFPAGAICSVSSFCWVPQAQAFSKALEVAYDCQLRNRANEERRCITFRRMHFLEPSQEAGCISARDNWEFQAAQNRLQGDPAARAQRFLRVSRIGRALLTNMVPAVVFRRLERLPTDQYGVPRHTHLTDSSTVDPIVLNDNPFPLNDDPFPLNSDPFPLSDNPIPIIFENPADEGSPQEELPLTTRPVGSVTRRTTKRKRTTVKPPIKG